jgi:hypothetical protein
MGDGIREARQRWSGVVIFSSLQLEVQDNGGDVPYTRRQSWPKFVTWHSSSFNNHALFEVQYAKFKLVSENPGESVHVYNVRWNLERDLVDELAVADLYPAGSLHVEDLESMHIHRLSGSLSSRLFDLRVIGGTLRQIVPGGAWTTDSDGGLSVGLISFKSIQSNLTMIRSLPLSSGNYNLLVLLLALSLGNRSPSNLSLEIFNGSPIWVWTNVFLNLRMRMRRNRNVARIFSSSFKQKARLTGRLIK